MSATNDLAAISKRALQLARRIGLPQVLLAVGRATSGHDYPSRKAAYVARIALSAAADAYGVDRKGVAQLYGKHVVFAVPRLVAVVAFRDATGYGIARAAAAFGFDNHVPILMARRRVDALRMNPEHASKFESTLVVVRSAWERTERREVSG